MALKLRSVFVFGGVVATTLLVALASCSSGDPARPSVATGPDASVADVVTADAADAGFDACARPAPPDATPADCTQIALPDGGRIRVNGVVRERAADGSVGDTVPFVNVAIEYGGLYVDYCDRSKASPYYQFGTITDDAGRFSFEAREGHLGFHTFATGYYYDRGQLDAATDDASVVLTMEKLKGETVPTITSPHFDKTSVEAGAPVTFTADVRAANRCLDPMSDEVLLIEPSTSWARELDPPSRGLRDDVPDGLFTLTFTAPTTPGTYTYYFATTTAYCVNSAVQSFTLQVQ